MRKQKREEEKETKRVKASDVKVRERKSEIERGYLMRNLTNMDVVPIKISSK